MKYYWLIINDSFNKFSGNQITSAYREVTIANEHPFSYMNRLRKFMPSLPGDNFSLINYKEITQEEHELFNSLKNA